MSYDSLRLNIQLDAEVELGDLLSELSEPWKRLNRTEYLRHLKVLYLNLYASYRSNLPLRLSLNNNDFTGSVLSYSSFRRIYKRMLALGYIEVVSGGGFNRERGRGYQTRIKSTERLVFPEIAVSDGHPLIVMKDGNREVVDLPDDPLLGDFARELREQNEFISRFHVTLDQLRPVNTNLYRVFNRIEGHYEGSRDYWGFEGGRLYGGWWQNIRKADRPRIQINGEQTVELDYSCFHPTILMAWEQRQLEGDPYQHPEVERATIKQWVNAVINADGETSAMRAIGGRENLATVLECFPALTRHVGSAVGRRLQFTDAQVAERVLRSMRGQGIPCLPIHDSFIVPIQCRDELREAMLASFREIVGGFRVNITETSL